MKQWPEMAIVRFYLSIVSICLAMSGSAFAESKQPVAGELESFAAEMVKADQLQIESAGMENSDRRIASVSKSSDPNELPPGKVEVIYSVDKLAPFNDRKSDFGFTFGFGVEQIYPDSYASRIDESSYNDLYGTSSIEMYEGKVGAKYNTHLGGVEIGAIGGYGSIYDGRIRNKVNVDTDATLDIHKYGLYGSLIMDTLFKEPYIVPYFEGQIFGYSWEEYAKTGEKSVGWTGLSFGAKVGALFQLNWLDPSAAFDGQVNWGLENTYVDLYTSYYQTTADDDNPDFSSSLSFGFGLKFEF